jgi:hypothetical protein
LFCDADIVFSQFRKNFFFFIHFHHLLCILSFL